MAAMAIGYPKDFTYALYTLYLQSTYLRESKSKSSAFEFRSMEVRHSDGGQNGKHLCSKNPYPALKPYQVMKRRRRAA